MTLPELLNLRRPLIMFDLETTGKRPSTARIVEIALTKFYPVDAGRAPYEWKALVNPGIPIPPEATAVHRIDDAAVAGAPRFEQFAAKLAAGMRDCDFGGYNIRYDVECLAAEFVRANVAWTADGARLVDGFRAWQVAEPRTLEDFARKYGRRPHDGFHGAAADVAAVIDGLEGILLATPGLPRDVERLHDALFPRDPSWVDAAGKFVWENGEAVVSFGKWKNTPLRRVSKSYLEWMSGGDFHADTKRVVRDAIAGRFPTPPEKSE